MPLVTLPHPHCLYRASAVIFIVESSSLYLDASRALFPANPASVASPNLDEGWQAHGYSCHLIIDTELKELQR